MMLPPRGLEAGLHEGSLIEGSLVFYEPFPIDLFQVGTKILSEGIIPRAAGFLKARSLSEFAGRLNDWIQNLLLVRRVKGEGPEGVSKSQERSLIAWMRWLPDEDQKRLAKYLHDYRVNERRRQDLKATWDVRDKDLAIQWASLKSALFPLVAAINSERYRLMWFDGKLLLEPEGKDEDTGELAPLTGSEETLKRVAGIEDIPMEVPLPSFSDVEQELPLFLRRSWDRLKVLRDVLQNLAHFGPPHRVMASALIATMLDRWSPKHLEGLNKETLSKDVERIRYERNFLGKGKILEFVPERGYLRIEHTGYVTMKTRDFVFGLYVIFETSVVLKESGEVLHQVLVTKIKSTSVEVASKAVAKGSWWGRFVDFLYGLVHRTEPGEEKVGVAVKRFDLNI